MFGIVIWKEVWSQISSKCNACKQ